MYGVKEGVGLSSRSNNRKLKNCLKWYVLGFLNLSFYVRDLGHKTVV